MQDYPQGEQEVTKRLVEALDLIKGDLRKVHREGLSSLMSPNGACQVPSQYQANVQVISSVCPLKVAVDTIGLGVALGCCQCLLW